MAPSALKKTYIAHHHLRTKGPISLSLSYFITYLVTGSFVLASVDDMKIARIINADRALKVRETQTRSSAKLFGESFQQANTPVR